VCDPGTGFGKIILHTGIDPPQCTSTYTGVVSELQYVLQYFQELQYILQYRPRDKVNTDTARGAAVYTDTAQQ
jgi:hypothetical protein